MRRQARLARRSGLQPMMVINTGDAFPETVGVVLLRGAWRYRSELAPVGVAAGLVAAAWWLHHTRPHWWFPVAVLAGRGRVGGGPVRRAVAVARRSLSAFTRLSRSTWAEYGFPSLSRSGRSSGRFRKPG